MKIRSTALGELFHIKHVLDFFMGVARPHPVEPPDFPSFETTPQKILRPESYLIIRLNSEIHGGQKHLGLAIVRSYDKERFLNGFHRISPRGFSEIVSFERPADDIRIIETGIQFSTGIAKSVVQSLSSCSVPFHDTRITSNHNTWLTIRPRSLNRD